MEPLNGYSPRVQSDPHKSRIAEILEHIYDMQDRLLREFGYVACLPPGLADLSAMELERILNTLTFKYLFNQREEK